MKPECKGDSEEPEEVITEGTLIKGQKYILPLSMEDKVQVTEVIGDNFKS